MGDSASWWSAAARLSPGAWKIIKLKQWYMMIHGKPLIKCMLCMYVCWGEGGGGLENHVIYLGTVPTYTLFIRNKNDFFFWKRPPHLLGYSLYWPPPHLPTLQIGTFPYWLSNGIVFIDIHVSFFFVLDSISDPLGYMIFGSHITAASLLKSKYSVQIVN